MSRKRVVLDTNIVLVSASRHSSHNWVMQEWVNGRYEVCVTTDILLEYAEIIGQKMGTRASMALMAMFDNLDNVQYITNYFSFELLADRDDNKFVDCAIAANADFIVSHDKDFRILKDIRFPYIEVIDLAEFKARIKYIPS